MKKIAWRILYPMSLVLAVVVAMNNTSWVLNFSAATWLAYATYRHLRQVLDDISRAEAEHRAFMDGLGSIARTRIPNSETSSPSTPTHTP